MKNFEIAFKKFKKDWKEISNFIQTRTSVQCYTYWRYNYCKKNILS